MKMEDNLIPMMNDSMLFELYDIENIKGDVIEARVKEKYGRGKIKFIRIEEGIFIVYSNCYFNHIDSYDIAYSKDIITIYQMIEGKAVMNINDKKSVIVKKGDVFNFAGNNQFSSFDENEKNMISISIFGYYDSIQKFFQSFYKEDIIVKEYYSKMKDKTGGLVYKSNWHLQKIFSELLESVKDNNNPIAKLRALEIMYDNMVHCDEYHKEKRDVYDSYYVKRVYEAKNYLDKNWHKKISIQEIALRYGINKTYFKDIFKDYFDITPHKYVIRMRLDRSKEMLKNKNMTISEIASLTGFSSASRYAESFHKNFGCLPSEYRKEF